MSKLKEFIIIVLAMVSFGGFIWGSQSYLEKRYALAEDVEKLSNRLDQKILEDRRDNIQQRIWKLEDKYSNEIPDDIKDQYRQFQKELEELDKKLDKLYEK